MNYQVRLFNTMLLYSHALYPRRIRQSFMYLMATISLQYSYYDFYYLKKIFNIIINYKNIIIYRYIEANCVNCLNSSFPFGLKYCEFVNSAESTTIL